MSENELKPCPFCGGKAELYESEAYNLKTEVKEKNTIEKILERKKRNGNISA